MDRPTTPPAALPALSVRDLHKRFILHLQGGTPIDAVSGISFDVMPGECVVLDGPSGAGKSTILKMIAGHYGVSAGSIRVRDGATFHDLAADETRPLAQIRQRTIGFVSQFLRVIPRVPAIEIVAEPLIANGTAPDVARQRAAALLERLGLPKTLWQLPPATFSGGEKQRVNIARGFARPVPVLLLDEPTAALDAGNRRPVVDLVREARAAGAAVLAVFHDTDVRTAVADRVVHVASPARRSSAPSGDTDRAHHP